LVFFVVEFFSFLRFCASRSLHSFPTRRSSDLILLLADNLGYGDVGSFGSQLHRTPNIDRLAEEGIRLTSFYVSSGVCTPSRASLDRKSTRLNSSHVKISYAVFCLKKKKE